MTTLDGLPAHILLVHAVVVLIPLSALMLILIAIWPGARARLVWPTAILTLVALISVPLTTDAGEWLERRVAASALVHTHTELGDTMLPWAIGLALVALVILARHLVARRAVPRHGGPGAAAMTELRPRGSAREPGGDGRHRRRHGACRRDRDRIDRHRLPHRRIRGCCRLDGPIQPAGPPAPGRPASGRQLNRPDGLRAGSEISVDELADLLREAPVLLDVRTADEFAEGHIPGSQLVPLSVLVAQETTLATSGRVYLVCGSGVTKYPRRGDPARPRDRRRRARRRASGLDNIRPSRERGH